MSELKPYTPSWRDRIASALMGNNPSQGRRNFVGGLMGSTGLGNQGLGLVDFVPGGQVFGAQEAAQQGDYQGAAFAMMPVPGASKVKAVAHGVEDAAGIAAHKLALPPTNPADYVDANAYNDILMRPYVKDGQVIASSRQVPFEGELPQLGAWRRSPYGGLYGNDIEQLRMVKINDLDLPETPGGVLDPMKRGDDARYAQWLNEGRSPPPLEVVEMDKGGLRVSDGHRRTLAAKQAGLDEVPAWVSFSVDAPHGKLDAMGNPIKTGLTDKIAETMGSDLTDLLRKYGVASISALPPAVQMGLSLMQEQEPNKS